MVSQSPQFQGVLFDGKTSGGTYTLQLLDGDGNVPATSLLHVKSTEILDGATSSNYINSVFTTNTLTTNTSITSKGTLTVAGSTTLNTLATSSNTSIGGTLTVAGTTTLNSNLTVSGVTTISQEKIEFSKPTIITNSLTISNNNLSINNGKIAFSPFNSSDSNPLIYSEVASENTNLVFELSDDATDSFIFRTKVFDLNGASPDTFTINRGGLSSLVNITAPTFVGSLSGNFTTSRTFTFSGGDISGSTSSNSGNYTVSATINNGAVTNDKILDGTIKTEKLGFNLNMTLSVTGDDSEHKTLTISLPTLNNK